MVFTKVGLHPNFALGSASLFSARGCGFLVSFGWRGIIVGREFSDFFCNFLKVGGVFASKIT